MRQADVVRLFSTHHMQTRLLQALTLLEGRLGSYSQGMAFVTAFMLLFLPDARAVAIALRLASDERYLKGYVPMCVYAYIIYVCLCVYVYVCLCVYVCVCV